MKLTEPTYRKLTVELDEDEIFFLAVAAEHQKQTVANFMRGAVIDSINQTMREMREKRKGDGG